MWGCRPSKIFLFVTSYHELEANNGLWKVFQALHKIFSKESYQVVERLPCFSGQNEQKKVLKALRASSYEFRD
jgi:hypothetical protein